MAKFVNVPAEALETALAEAGFTRTVQGREVVFIRGHHAYPDYTVKVYTSIRVGEDDARAKGTDAIRVCLVQGDVRTGRGVAQSIKVLRTTSPASVVKRMLKAARTQYAAACEKGRAGRKPADLPGAAQTARRTSAAGATRRAYGRWFWSGTGQSA
jgi:hypothetical protein